MLINGSRADNRLTGTIDDDVFRGFGGDDIICGRGGNDLMFGHSGNDVIFGGNGDDEVRGNNGNDFVNGGNGNDLVFGGNGDDTVIGGDGADVIRGGDGDDVLVSVGSGEDVDRIDRNLIGANEDQGNGVGSLAIQTEDDDQFILFLNSDVIVDPDSGFLVEDNVIFNSFDFENSAPLHIADVLIGGAGNDLFVVGGDVTAILDFTPGEDTIQADGFEVALTQSFSGNADDPDAPLIQNPAQVEVGDAAAVAFINDETGQLLLVGSSHATIDQIVDAVVITDTV